MLTNGEKLYAEVTNLAAQANTGIDIVLHAIVGFFVILVKAISDNVVGGVVIRQHRRLEHLRIDFNFPVLSKGHASPYGRCSKTLIGILFGAVIENEVAAVVKAVSLIGNPEE